MKHSELPEATDLDELLLGTELFQRVEPEARALIADGFELKSFSRGTAVMRQGEEADGLYLVAAGRLQVTFDGAEDTTVTEIGPGQLVGEMALLTNRPRSATVVAVRDTHAFFLSSDSFEDVVRTFPSAFRAVTSALLDRLLTQVRHGGLTSPATNLVIVRLDDAVDADGFSENLAAALERVVQPVRVVRETDVEPALRGSASSVGRARWREQLEAANRSVVYVTHPTYDGWTAECIRQADLVILLANARSAPKTTRLEQQMLADLSSIRPRTELVLLHDSTADSARGTSAWLAHRAVARHHHIRADCQADFERVARLLVDRAIGVVFSGGGARGLSHIGVLRALTEQGIPIDAIAGASIGAIIGCAIARGDDYNRIAAMMRAAVVDRSPIDFTLPTVSLAAGRRVTRNIERSARGIRLEDTWINFRCVSTNLTRGALEIHESGPAWEAIRASFAVPALFPPMINSEGDVLVDGGLLDNMPVGPLRAAHPGITVIAVDVGARRQFTAGEVPAKGVVSGWQQLVTSLRARNTAALTSLPKVLLRLTELGSLGDDDRGDFLVRPDLDGVSLLDFNRLDELVVRGEESAAKQIADWQATGALVGSGDD